MKAWIGIFIILGCCLAQAENLQLKNGSVLKNTTIISADPERMLIVHDGGGQQIEYAELERNSITPAQRVKIEGLLKKYAERKRKRQELLLQQQAFEKAQMEKGLVLFEGNWMSPADRQQLLTLREVARLEQQRMKLELAQEKIELKKAELKARQGDELLDGPAKSIIFNTGRTWPSYGGHGRVYAPHWTGRRRPPLRFEIR